MADDPEDERTVVGVIPSEIMAESRRGGRGGGLERFMQRPETPQPPTATSSPDEDLEVEEVLTSAPNLGEHPPPLPTSRPAPPPTPADEDLDDPAHLAEGAPAIALVDPFAPPVSEGAPSLAIGEATDEDLEGLELGSPASLPGPKLVEPEERLFSPDEVTYSGRAPEVARAPVPTRPSTSAEESTSQALAAPRSLLPQPLPAAETAWPDETDAVTHTTLMGLGDEMSDRARWLADEARLCDDPILQRRTLLQAAEMLLLVGEEERGKALADEASAASRGHLLVEQARRSKAMRDGDFGVVVQAMTDELEAAHETERRAHLSLAMATLQRVALRDPDAAAGRVADALKAAGSSTRAHVAEVARALSQPGPVATHSWPDGEGFAPLRTATARLEAARSGAPGELLGPPHALRRARMAAEGHDVASATQALEGLGELREIGEASEWLAAAIAAPSRATRPDAVRLLGRLRRGSLHREAARALATRALELGDLGPLHEALATDGALDGIESAAVLALSGDGPGATSAALALGDEARPLASAVIGACDTTTTPPPSTSSDAAHALALGRALGRRQELTPHLRSGEAEASTLEGVLRAERHLGEKDGRALADTLGLTDTAERLVVASILRELASDLDGARASLGAAIAMDPTSEPATRALGQLATDRAGSLYATLAGSLEDGSRKALLWLAAASRAEGEERHDLLRKAHDAAPELGIATLLGARAARTEGSAPHLIEWVRTAREAAIHPVERAYEEVREAMLIADADADDAATLLESASVTRPGDDAIAVLLGRLGREAPERPIAELVDQCAKAPPAARERLTSMLALARFERGDLAGAASAAAQATQPLGRALADEIDAMGPGAARLAEELMLRARAATEGAEERELYLRLAELDERGRGDLSSALLWHRTILEKDPTCLVSLRQLEQVLTTEGREDELEPIFGEIARATAGREAVAHAIVAARLRLRTAPWEATRDLADLAASGAPPSLWGERQLLAHGSSSGDPEIWLRAASALLARTDRPRERATLLLRAADAALALGQPVEAADRCREALTLVPDHPTAPEKLAQALLATGDPAGAAESFERAADASRVVSHQVELLHTAAVIWLDRAHDSDRGLAALERVSEADPTYGDTFDRLRRLYTERGDGPRLAALLERRLESETDPARRLELEITRGRALSEMGDLEAAKAALSAALDVSPDHVEALRTFAGLCEDTSDAERAEQALIRLARLEKDPEQQAELYARLGALYRGPLVNLERAEVSYREVLKRRPGDAAASEALLELYVEAKDAPQALEVATALVSSAKDPADKRQRTIQLAKVHEIVLGDVKRAEQTLEALRKEQPHDAAALRALAELHLRQDHLPAANMLLDRAANDARRALQTGRFELHLFATLAAVFELRGQHDAAQVADATLRALEGESSDISGVGFRAGRRELDEQLAPEVFTPALRALLGHVTGALDGATAVDLRGLRATPFPVSAQQVAQELTALAAAFGVVSPQLFVSSTVGSVVLPVSSAPPVLVFGAALVAEPNAAIRSFLAIRAFKMVAANVAAFARTAPIDLGPLVAAMLQVLAPSWSPMGIDAHKLTDFRAKLQRHQTGALSPEASALALEVIGTLGNKASTLQTAANAWGNRAALLATGDLKGALDAIAYAAGQAAGAPAAGPDRLKWIGRNAEARDLVVFSVSSEYAHARSV